MQEVKIVLKNDSVISIIDTNSPEQIQKLYPKSDKWVLRNSLLYWVPIDDKEVEFSSSVITHSGLRSSLMILDIKDGLALVQPIVSSVPINNDMVLFNI